MEVDITAAAVKFYVRDVRGAVILQESDVGYRYAARGLRLDGWRSDADLHFGKQQPIACTVALD
jgi:hypothetical protein